MGSSSSVSISTQLDRENTLFFAGELISGTVNVNIKEHVIKVDEVFVLLQGETGYTTTRTIQETNGTRRTETNHHTTTFLKLKCLLASPEPGQKELVYHPGDYSWRFEIPLPDHLPPTLNQPYSYPRVRYDLRFVIDKSWYKRNKSETLHLTIFPCVNLMYNPQWLTPTVFSNSNRKDVILKGNLDKTGYLSGDTVIGQLEIDNPRQILIKRIHVTLTQYNRIESNTRHETIFETYLPTIERRNDRQIIERFSIPIPFIPLAPSSDFHSGYDHTTHVDVYYTLEVDVKVEGIFTDFKVSIPITIGTEFGTKNSNQYDSYEATKVSPNSVSSYPEINADDMTQPPPSYSSLYH